MHKSVFLLTVLVLGLVTGCGIELPSPVPTTAATTAPTSPPLPTATAEEEIDTSSTSETVSSAASCVAMPFDFPVEPRIPPISEEDHTHGSADASITLIEYADFQ
jgi:hypothetical protein